MPPHLSHYYVVVDARHKADCLRKLIHALDLQRVLVFMNYQVRLDPERGWLCCCSSGLPVRHSPRVSSGMSHEGCLMKDGLQGSSTYAHRAFC